MNETYIASCSFGKDSIATIILAKLHNEPLDKVLYVECMFDNKRNISAEYPEHVYWIYKFAIPTLKKEFGIIVDVVRTENDYMKFFNHILTNRSKYEGRKQGFLLGKKCKMNSNGKIKEIKKYKKQFENVIDYVGIAVDEPIRLARLKKNQISLLAKYGYSEKMAYELCKSYNLLSPIYSLVFRAGCWFCPNARLNQLNHIYINHRDLWNELVVLSKTPNLISYGFKYGKTIESLEKLFEAENKQLKLEFNI